MNALHGRVAIVTGGARGIGAAISRRFAREGAALVVNDLGSDKDGAGADNGPAFEIVAEITAEGGQAVADGGDISDTATGRRLVDLAVEKFGRLDIVVNAAGILRDRMIFNMTDDDWDAVIRVHLRGHFSTIRPASAYFREQRNPDAQYRIINFTSLAGLQGSPGQPNYSSAKLGIVGLTYSVAQSLAKYGVTANAISPIAATRLTADLPPEKDIASVSDPEQLSAENIAAIALYLAGERSSWLSGRVISSEGYTVGLYNNPRAIEQVTNHARWTPDELADAMETQFRPLADGLPENIFAGQAG
jgi:NAD(P)-dependent dehydrogenase (short-subunit alcohol dehydrogenase family)